MRNPIPELQSLMRATQEQVARTTGETAGLRLLTTPLLLLTALAWAGAGFLVIRRATPR